MPVSSPTPPISGSATPAPAQPTTSSPAGQVQVPVVQQQPVRPSALNAAHGSGPPTRGSLPGWTPSFKNVASRDDRRNYSQAHIAGKPFVPPNEGPESISAFLQNNVSNNCRELLERLKHFLGSTLSNNRYESMEQLHLRAENLLNHLAAEKKMLEQTTAGLQDPNSPVHRQATWMAHLERLNWREGAPLAPNDRALRAREIEAGQGFAPGSPFEGLGLTEPIAKTLAIMLAVKQGPFTEQQALAGFELAGLGGVLGYRLGIQERMHFAGEHGVYPERKDTHPTRTPDGLDLSDDLGTQLRDEYHLPVMTGTSGTASDATQSAKFASTYAGVSWAAPGLSLEQARQAISDLGLHHFRGEGSAVASHIAGGMNRLRAAVDLRPMHLDALHVFTHSYPEVDAAVRLTLRGQPGFDEQAMREVTQASAQRLEEVAAQWALQAQGRGVRQAVGPSALSAAHEPGPPPRGSLPGSTAPFTSRTARDDWRNYSQAHIAGKPFVPDKGPESIRAFLQNSVSNNRREFLEKLQQFLASTLSNSRYGSIDQLHLRAENFLHHFEAEKKMLEQTAAGLQDPDSPVYRQASWLAHLERLNWREEASLEPSTRAQLAREIERGRGFAQDSPFSGFSVPQPIALALSMMFEAKQGPLIEPQALAGFELAQAGAAIAYLLGFEERATFRDQHHVYADRQGTHLTTTADGLDLSEDLGTQLRDKYRLPVMTGTSSSASEVAQSAKSASIKAGVPWAAPGLSEEQAQRAISDLGLQFFRGEGSTPSNYIAAGVNRLRAAAHLPPMRVDSQHVFSHSYPEIDAAVRLTLAGKSGLDEQAMREVTRASVQRLAEIANELELEAKQTKSDDKLHPSAPQP
jgi:hypothetical protein